MLIRFAVEGSRYAATTTRTVRHSLRCCGQELIVHCRWVDQRRLHSHRPLGFDIRYHRGAKYVHIRLCSVAHSDTVFVQLLVVLPGLAHMSVYICGLFFVWKHATRLVQALSLDMLYSTCYFCTSLVRLDADSGYVLFGLFGRNSGQLQLASGAVDKLTTQHTLIAYVLWACRICRIRSCL